MKRSIRLSALVATVALAVALCASQTAQAGPAEPSVPSAIVVPEGHKLFLVADAVGVQIHSCDAVGTSFRLTFVAPRADLFDDKGKLLTTHFGGPTWQAKDGSLVVGQVEQRVTVDPTAIPWLRLVAASTAAGTDGYRLAHTTFVQRLETTGGLAPSPETCHAGTVGKIAEVPYTAVYAFWKASGH